MSCEIPTNGREPVNLNWSYFTSIFDRKEWIQRITDNPLFVVHPGFCSYYPEEDRYLRPLDYRKYQIARDREISKALASSRTVFTLVHTDYLPDTVSSVKATLNNSIMVPTIGSGIDINKKLIKVTDDRLWETISNRITQGEICGEYGDFVSCISGLIKIFEKIKIPLRRIDDAIYNNYSELAF